MIDSFTLSPADISYVGTNLSRPECILAQPDGTLWIADNRGGVTRMDPDGRQTLLGDIAGLPNGLAMDRDGTLLVAEIEHGRLLRLHRDGRSELVLDALDGVPLGAVNFVYRDHQDRVWVTVSTRLVPRRPAATTPSHDGYILLIADGQARIVAEGLCFTNELRVDAAGRYLYVAETSLRRISRYTIAADGSLHDKIPYGPGDLGGRPDGIALDVDGNLWLTEVDHNALWVITPDQRAHCVFQDPQAQHIHFPASLTFAGPDLRTVLVGSLRMDRLPSFRAPVAGAALAHWGQVA